MRKLYEFNKIILIITALLYLIIILGLYAQIVLGAIQLLSALSVTFLWHTLDKRSKKHLSIYWLIVSLYGLGWLLQIELNNYSWWICIIIIPMTIAIYFVWILSNLKNLNYGKPETSK